MDSRSGSSSPPPGDLPEGVREVVNFSQAPALILELTTDRIVAVSPAARDLLSPGGDELVGRTFEALTDDPPTGALGLLMEGRLNAYETRRQFRLRDGSTVPLQVWVRALGGSVPLRYALVVIMADGRPAGGRALPVTRGLQRRDRHDRRQPRDRPGEQ